MADFRNHVASRWIHTELYMSRDCLYKIFRSVSDLLYPKQLSYLVHKLKGIFLAMFLTFCRYRVI